MRWVTTPATAEQDTRRVYTSLHRARLPLILCLKGNGPLGIASGTDTRHHNGHQGGPVDRADQRVEGAIGARAIQNQVGDKQQEVKAIKAQSAELAEAERLEREAKMHRDRAVAGGEFVCFYGSSLANVAYRCSSSQPASWCGVADVR